MTEWEAPGRRAVLEMIDDLARSGPDGEPELQAIEEAPEIHDLWQLRGHVESCIAAARRLKSVIDAEIGDRLDGGVIRLGDSVLQYRERTELVIPDPDSLFAYLGDDIVECFNPTYIRRTSVRAILERRVREADPDAPEHVVKRSVRAKFDSLFVYEPTGEHQLQVTPAPRAPQWAQRLKDGERALPPRRGGM